MINRYSYRNVKGKYKVHTPGVTYMGNVMYTDNPREACWMANKRNGSIESVIKSSTVCKRNENNVWQVYYDVED